MVATIILSLLIFGIAGYIVYRSVFLKKGSCDCDGCDCPAKTSQKKNKSL